MKPVSLIPAALLALGVLMPAVAPAHEAGDWLLRFGAHVIDPKSDNGSLAGGALAVDVGSDIKPTAMIEYMLSDRLGLELIVAAPFRHDIKLNGADAGSTRQLPPTLSLQWHFNPGATVQPFLGAGINYTWFDGERSAGPIAGTELRLSNSWGWAVHAGIDFQLNPRWFVGADLRWIDIDSKVRVDGAKVGTVNIDPIAYGVYVGYRF